MNVIRYKDLSDAHVIEQITPGKTLYQSFEGLDFSKHIILVNGQKHYPDYIAREGDIIVIRSIPGEAVTVALIIVAVISLGLAIYAGTEAYKARKQAEALEDKLRNVSDSVKNIPYLKGASNALATGKSQPFIIGEHLFTPYLVSKGYKTIAGTNGVDQYYYVVLEGGFNKQVLRKLSADDVILRDWGTSETTPQEGVYAFDTDSVFYDADSLIEVAQDGAAFTTASFNVKVVSNETGDQMKKSDDPAYEDLIYTIPLRSRSADVCIMFNGLLKYNSDGNSSTRTVTVTPSYSLNSGTSWTPFTFDVNGTATNAIAGNIASQVRYNAHIDFTYAQVSELTEPVLIKLVCSTPKYSGSAFDDCYVQWTQSLIYNPDASTLAGAFVNEKLIDAPEAALSTLIGLKIKASQSNQDKLGKINVITSGVARTWDGSEWSSTKVPTRNPAAWLLEVLTSPTHLPSQVDDSEIDLDSFGTLYGSCVEDSLFSDMVLAEGDTKAAVFARLCDVCFSVLYKDIYGQISVINDAVRPNAIAILNTQNCISFDNKKDLSRRVDGLKIKYISRDAGYEEDTYLVMRDGVTRGTETILRDMVVEGVTTFDHVVRYARRIMAIESLRPKTITAKVGKEGTYYTPLAKVLVQHPSLKIGLGSAEIKTVINDGTYITGVELYEPIQYYAPDPDGYGAIIQCVSETYSTPLSAGYTAASDGLVSAITFVTPILLSAAAIPHPGDILSYGFRNGGAFDTITSPMLIAGIEPDKEGFTLSLVDYNAAIYTVGGIPAYVPNFTKKITPTALPEELPVMESMYISFIFTRSSTTPSTPSGDPPSGWYDAPPVEGGLLWMSKATRSALGVLISDWSAPVMMTGEQGNPGPAGGSVTWLGDFADPPNAPLDSQAYHNTTDGKSYVFNEAGDATYPDDAPDENRDGFDTWYPSDTIEESYGVYPSEGTWFVMTVDGNNLLVQWSADNTNWHYEFATGDIYMRTSNDGGYYWEPGARVVGEDGAQGPIGPQGENAVVMTSLTAPAGTFTGQIGMYLNRFYRWSGSSWVLVDTKPKYLGTVHVVPTTRTAYIHKGPTLANVDAIIDDWVLMTEAGTSWTQGDCYKYRGTVAGWVHLDYVTTAGVATNYEEYQAAATDIFGITALQTAPTGHFAAVFSAMIMAQQATIDTISTKRLNLSGTGLINSGAGHFNNADTSVYLGGDGRFSLKDKLSWDGVNLNIVGGGTFSGILDAAGGKFNGEVSTRYGFILEGIIPTNQYARISWEYIRVYNRKSAYTSPVPGDMYNEISSNGSMLYLYDGTTYQEVSGYNRYFVSSPALIADKINSGANSIVSTVTWQNVLGEDFYNNEAMGNGFILIPLPDAGRLQVFFKISVLDNITALKLDVIERTDDYFDVSTVISIQANRLKCKKATTGNGHINWIKIN